MKRSRKLSATCRSIGLCVAATAGAFALAVGCSKKKPVQYPPTPPRNYTTNTAPAPDAGPMPAPDAGAVPAPDAAPPPAAEAGPQGVDMVTQQTLEAAIKKRAPKQARYMKKEGAAFSGMLQQGGQIEQQFMIQPHKCYGVLAQGGPGVTEVDIQITAKPMAGLPLPSAVIAVDSTTGPAAAITPCWKNAFPVAFPATAVVKATHGAGAVVAQIYVK